MAFQKLISCVVFSLLVLAVKGSKCPESESPSKLIVCYYEGSAALDHTNICNCTHLVFTTIATTEDFNVTFQNDVTNTVKTALDLKHLNMIFTVNLQPSQTSALLKSEDKKIDLLNSISALIRTSDFSGVELNFEFSADDGARKEGLVALVKDLRTTLDHHRVKRDGYSVFEDQLDDITTGRYSTEKYVNIKNPTTKKSIIKRKKSRTPRENAENKNVDFYDEEDDISSIDEYLEEPLLKRTKRRKQRFDEEGEEKDEEEVQRNYEYTIMLRLSITPEIIAKKYDLKALSKYVDYMVVPTHMITDESEKGVTFHPSRLMGLSDILNTDSILDLLTGLGAVKSKLIISIPAMVLQYELKDAKKNTVRSPTVGSPKKISKAKMCSLLKSGEWTVERDEDLTAPYAFSKTTWLAFEDEISTNIKGKYIILRELAGGAIYPIDSDISGEDCANKQGGRQASTLLSNFGGLARKPRQVVLESLQEEIHDTAFYSQEAGVHLSQYRIVRVVDHSGAVHVIRKNAKTEFECSRQGYFSHPLGCNKFYRCVKFDQYKDDFTVFEYDCPSGLAFDERWEVCVWPGSLPHGAPCTGSSEIAPVPRSYYQCPNVEGYFADPENCRWFFACLDHARDGVTPLTAYEFRCPFGLVFDEDKLICDWPWSVGGCGARGAAGVVITKTAGASSYQGAASILANGGYINGALQDHQSRASFATIPDYIISGGRIANKGGVILNQNLLGTFEGPAGVGSPIGSSSYLVEDGGSKHRENLLQTIQATPSTIIEDGGSRHREGILQSVKVTPPSFILEDSGSHQEQEGLHAVHVTPSSFLTEDGGSNHRSNVVQTIQVNTPKPQLYGQNGYLQQPFFGNYDATLQLGTPLTSYPEKTAAQSVLLPKSYGEYQQDISLKPKFQDVLFDENDGKKNNAFNEGYKYDKPSIPFELPSKTSSVGEGYQYDKPSIPFELPPKNGYLPPLQQTKLAVYAQNNLEYQNVPKIIPERPIINLYAQPVTPRPKIYAQNVVPVATLKPVVYQKHYITPKPIIYNQVIQQKPIVVQSYATPKPVFYQQNVTPKRVIYQSPVSLRPVFYQKEIVTPRPIIVQQQVVTPKPVIYQQEIISPKPIIYQQEISPVVSVKPIIQQVITPKPIVYQKTYVTPKPVVYQQEIVTPKPIVYEEKQIYQPVVTPKPVVYQLPYVTPKPIVYEQKQEIVQEIVTPKPVVYEQQQYVTAKPVVYEQQQYVTAKPVVYEQQQYVTAKPVVYEQQQYVTAKPVVYEQKQYVTAKPVVYEQQQYVTAKPVVHEQQQYVTAKPVVHEQQQYVTAKPVVYEQQQYVTAKPVVYKQQQYVTAKPVVHEQQQYVTAKPVVYEQKQEIVQPIIAPKQIVPQQIITPRPTVYKVQPVVQEVVSPQPVIYQPTLTTKPVVSLPQYFASPTPVTYQQGIIQPLVTERPAINLYIRRPSTTSKAILYQQLFNIPTPQPITIKKKLIEEQYVQPEITYRQEVVTPKPIIYQQQAPVVYQQEVITPRPVIYEEKVPTIKTVQPINHAKPVFYEQQTYITPKTVVSQEISTPKPVVYQQNYEVQQQHEIIEVQTERPIIYQQVTTPKTLLYQQTYNIQQPQTKVNQEFIKVKAEKPIIYQEVTTPKTLSYQQNYEIPQQDIKNQLGIVKTQLPVVYEQRRKNVLIQTTSRPTFIEAITPKVYRPTVVQQEALIGTIQTTPKTIYAESYERVNPGVAILQKEVYQPVDVFSVKTESEPYSANEYLPPSTQENIDIQKVGKVDLTTAQPFATISEIPKYEINAKIEIAPPPDGYESNLPSTTNEPTRYTLKQRNRIRVRPVTTTEASREYLPPVDSSRRRGKSRGKTTIVSIGQVDKSEVDDKNLEGVLDKYSGKYGELSDEDKDKFVTKVIKGNGRGIIKVGKEPEISTVGYEVTSSRGRSRSRGGGSRFSTTSTTDATEEEHSVSSTTPLGNDDDDTDTGDISLATLDLKNLKVKKDKKTVIVVSQVSDANPILIGKLAGQCSCQSNKVDLKNKGRRPSGRRENGDNGNGEPTRNDDSQGDKENAPVRDRKYPRGRSKVNNNDDESNGRPYNDGESTTVGSERGRTGKSRGRRPYDQDKDNNSENFGRGGLGDENPNNDYNDNNGYKNGRRGDAKGRGPNGYGSDDNDNSNNGVVNRDGFYNYDQPEVTPVLIGEFRGRKGSNRGQPIYLDNIATEDGPSSSPQHNVEILNENVSPNGLTSTTTILPEVSPSILLPLAPSRSESTTEHVVLLPEKAKARRIPSRSKARVPFIKDTSPLFSPITADEIASTVDYGTVKPVEGFNEISAGERAKTRAGASFDRYGPGGMRSFDETLQGSVDCKRPGLFRHPKYCNKFYSCNYDPWKKRYTLAVFNCPVHLAYDSNIGACNWPSKGPACADDNLLV